MNKSLTRSIGFWLLLVLALASTAVGGWLISGQIGTMTTTLLDNTATGVDVYVGQSLVVVGSALLGAGVLGILLAVALVAVQSLIPAATPVVVEPIDWTAEVDDTTAPVGDATVTAVDETSADEALGTPVNDDVEADAETDDQKGSSGSTATATKINVK
ncbi:hypothetical protein [Microbacterium galbinum]|uniref:hypothetical protein n=1 Tax=Microbacterium galbinum TaxID=2851646 RepID=UPI001FFC417D|nr:hypothetical protein [Microbacterium galbinum]